MYAANLTILCHDCAWHEASSYVLRCLPEGRLIPMSLVAVHKAGMHKKPSGIELRFPHL